MKKIMVDLDDTLVSYSEMFINRANTVIGSYQEYPDIILKHEDIEDYDFEVLFNRKIPNDKIWYTPKTLLKKVIESVYTDESFYLNPIWTKECKTIFKMIMDWRINEDVHIELNTKVSTPEMIVAKSRLFKKDPRFNYFDNIIIDLDKGWIHKSKRTDYDIMIDDSPTIIRNYLENNPNGKVIMPLRKWNECFVGTPRVEVLEVNKEL